MDDYRRYMNLKIALGIVYVCAFFLGMRIHTIQQLL